MNAAKIVLCVVLPTLVVYIVHGASTLHNLFRDYCWSGNYSNWCKHSNPPVAMVQPLQEWQVCRAAGTLGECHQSMRHDNHMGPGEGEEGGEEGGEEEGEERFFSHN